MVKENGGITFFRVYGLFMLRSLARFLVPGRVSSYEVSSKSL